MVARAAISVSLEPSKQDASDTSIFWYQGQAWYRHEIGSDVVYVSPTRIYVPVDGRFVERDPVGWMELAGADPGSINSYGYYGVNSVDPDGRDGLSTGCKQDQLERLVVLIADYLFPPLCRCPYLRPIQVRQPDPQLAKSPDELGAEALVHKGSIAAWDVDSAPGQEMRLPAQLVFQGGTDVDMDHGFQEFGGVRSETRLDPKQQTQRAGESGVKAGPGGGSSTQWNAREGDSQLFSFEFTNGAPPLAKGEYVTVMFKIRVFGRPKGKCKERVCEIKFRVYGAAS